MKKCASPWARLDVPLFAQVALTAVLAMTGREALASVPPRGDSPPGLMVILASVVTPGSEAAWRDTHYLSRAGMEPDSIKARIAQAWFDRLLADPAVAIAVPGGTAGLEAKLRDDVARERMIKNGIPRLAPDERLAYFMLLTKYIGEAAHGDCHGVTSMQDIVNRISVGNMSDSDAAEYFALLHRIVIRSLLAAPLTQPTPVQFEMALRHLDDVVNAALAGDPPALARMVRITSGAPGATVADVCWASAFLMRAVVEMDGPDRDALLLYMLDEDESAQKQDAAATHAR
jgi:hypothetical protein